MAAADFHGVEFGVCLWVEDEEVLYRVPIDNSVREALSDMYDAFYETYNLEDDPGQYSVSEKYSGTESLLMALDHEHLGKIQALYNE